MILRLWRAPVPADQVKAFDAFMREHLLPRMAEHPACRSVTTAVDDEGEVPEVVAVSTWTSMEELRSFTGPEKPSGVILPEAERFLAGKPRVEHLTVLAHAAET